MACRNSRLTPPPRSEFGADIRAFEGSTDAVKEPGSIPGSRVRGSTMSSLPSQGQPPIVEPALPPMPRRQSCDRCHELKVRCVTDGYDDTLGLGGIGEESEATRGRSVIAPIPCVRCSKAGAVCIFSPQLRSGRPRVHRHPARKRARRSSKCSSSPTELSPTHSKSLSPRPSMFNFLPSSTRPELETYSHPQTAPLLLSTIVPPNLDGDYSSQGGADLGTPATLMSSFGLPVNHDHFPVHHDHFQTFSHSTGGSSAQCAPTFSENLLSATSTTSDNPWMYPSSSEGYLQEATQINLRIHRAGRMLLPLTRTLLTISSPAINEVFDAACSLISFVDRYVTRQMISPEASLLDKTRTGSDAYQIGPATIRSSVPGHSLHGFSSSSPINSAAETSISLVVLASHQLLLGIFEDLCTSFLFRINRGRPTTPPNTPSTGGVFFGSSHSQMPAMANLISHLMEQLDRVLQSLAAQQDTAESSGGLTVAAAAAAAAAAASTHDGGFDHELACGHPPEASQISQNPSFEGQKNTRLTPQPKDGGVVSMILIQVEQRQVRAREQMMTLKRLLGQDGV
ncbi:hypothetical protein B0T21DRAFT_287364 [Apiosordaria backusii]|uniref:Zn(2)-C6 fungal-type domain-containing protein n=1 Tax=Apiosordaria backusii TaxID=314023 RepID=A0AA40EI92_9PEZI|nr:hypothetical protein B0T21DRAFT_287364 [Apiosordaria backusii]